MLKVFEIVPDWENKNLICCKCGETKGVKNKCVLEKGDNVYYCNNCTLNKLYEVTYNKSRVKG